MLKVLLDARVLVGGVGRYVEALTSGFDQLQGRIHPVVFHRSRAYPARLLTAPFTPWGAAFVRTEIRRRKVDLLHGTLLEVAHPDFPSVVTIHDVIPLIHPASMPSRFRRLRFLQLARASIARAAEIIVPSRLTASHLMRLGLTRATPTVIANAPVGPFRPLSDLEIQTARVAWAGGRPYLAAVTGVKSHKNALGLARTAEVIFDRTGLPVVAVGAPEEMRSRSLVPAVDLDDVELARLMGGAEVFLLPSVVEGFGYPLLEAAMCNVSVVCGPEIGALEVLGDAAVVVDTTDAERTALAVLSLLGDEMQRRERGLAAATRITDLTPRSMASETANVYERAVAR